jgi:hypothetical protein
MIAKIIEAAGMDERAVTSGPPLVAGRAST